MTQHALVYIVEFQWLVLVGWDSLVINITNYENNQSIINRIRSSSQNRLRRERKILRRQLRPTSLRRWLHSSRACLDKLNLTACRHRWTVRQPHPRDLHEQKEQTGHQVPHPTCLTSTARYTKRGLYIPLFCSRGCSLSTCHHTFHSTEWQ